MGCVGGFGEGRGSSALATAQQQGGSLLDARQGEEGGLGRSKHCNVEGGQTGGIVEGDSSKQSAQSEAQILF